MIRITYTWRGPPCGLPCPTCYDLVTERGWKSNSTVRLSSMQNRQTIFIWAVCLWTVTLPGLSGQTTQVEGSVRDPSGAVIANASVVLNSGSYQAAVNTGADGHFLFLTVPSISGTVDISREGFNPVRQSWNLGSATSVSLEIVLHPGAASEQVTVSAARTEVRLFGDLQAARFCLVEKDVAATPALRVDDVLRQVLRIFFFVDPIAVRPMPRIRVYRCEVWAGPPQVAPWCSKMAFR